MLAWLASPSAPPIHPPIRSSLPTAELRPSTHSLPSKHLSELTPGRPSPPFLPSPHSQLRSRRVAPLLRPFSRCPAIARVSALWALPCCGWRRPPARWRGYSRTAFTPPGTAVHIRCSSSQDARRKIRKHQQAGQADHSICDTCTGLVWPPDRPRDFPRRRARARPQRGKRRQGESCPSAVRSLSRRVVAYRWGGGGGRVWLDWTAILIEHRALSPDYLLLASVR